MSIKAVLFDVGDTLWYSQDPPGKEELRRIAARRVERVMESEGISGAEPARVASSAFTAIEDAIDDAREGSLQEPDYAEVARDRLETIGVAVTREQARRLIEAAYVSGPEGGKAPFRDARATLDTLRDRGFRLGIVTNRAFGGDRFSDDLRATGLDVGWDVKSVSVEVGYLKPHPAIFQHALRSLSLEPDQTLMVGNSLREDIAGAQGLGIRAAWLRSSPDADGVVPDYTVECISDLLAVPVLESS